MLNSLKKYFKWIVVTIVVAIIAILFLLSQTPKVISATVSPEVIVKGQSTEVVVRAIVSTHFFIPPMVNIKAVLAKQGLDYNIFNGELKPLGNLKNQGLDKHGNYIYQATFVINNDQAETLKVQ